MYYLVIYTIHCDKIIDNITHRRHERVQDADGESRTARKRLSEIQLRVGVVVIVLVKKLHVAVVDQFGDHRHVGAVHRPPSLQHYWPASAVQTIRIELFGYSGLVCMQNKKYPEKYVKKSNNKKIRKYIYYANT